MLRFLAVLLMILPFAAGAQQDVRAFVFGNSLINHVSGNDNTTMPYWLAQLARAGGRGFALDGTFGFPRDLADRLPPEPGWSFNGVDRVWDSENYGFRRAGFNTIILNPENFVQDQAPDAAYYDATDGASPLSATLRIFDYTDGQVAGAQYFIYEGWANLGVFPPDAGQTAAYHAFNAGAYHDWYRAYVAGLSTASRPVKLIPVASVLSRLLTETPLAALRPQDLYSDDAPHGTANLYFLAALITYSSLYGAAPPDFTPPADLHPLVRDSYPQIAAFVWQAVSGAVSTGAAQSDNPAPALAMGLNGIADWSTQMPFIDLMKTARPWVGHLPGQWGGFEAAQFEAGGYLDPHGWPLAIPEGVERIETFILTDQPAGFASLAGRYRLTFDGTGRIELGGLARDIGAIPGEMWFRYTPGDGPVGIGISALNPADPIRNIVVVREEMVALYQAGAVFNPAWLRHIRDLRLLRFMDWMNTNGSDQVVWADRPLPTDYSYARRGVPVELMVQLANEVGADAWFNMPHQADDAYVTAFATLVHDSLDPRLHASVEYSNELWNFIFPQTQWAIEQAQARWGDAAGDDAWMQFAGARAAEMADIWAAVYGPDSDRLVRVIATHTGWPGLEEPLLMAPLAVAEGFAPPVNSFDAYAVTGYFGYDIGSDEMADTLRGWITAGDATARVTAQIRSGSLAELLGETLPYHARAAAAHDLDLIMYEGGTHVVGLGEQVNDDTLTAFLTAFNYSPEMAQLYAELLTGWRAAGGTLFNAFVDVAPPSKWGSWGALQHLDDVNPRAATLMAYNASGADWEVRPPDTFAQGEVFTGTPGADVIDGTHEEDVMIGLDGDDVFVVRSADRINGGLGFDTVVLPGIGPEFDIVWSGDRVIVSGNQGHVTLFDIENITMAGSPGRNFMPETVAN